MVFEVQGGVEPRCAAILHRIAIAVAAAEGSDIQVTKAALLHRIAILIARGTAESVRRRDAPRGGSSCRTVQSASARLLSESASRNEEEEVV